MPELDLLIEIGTEELPPKALQLLSNAFGREIGNNLNNASLGFQSLDNFATPRRLAVIVRALETKQADAIIEKLGPAVQTAFDSDGNPGRAAEGFAQSCGVAVDELTQKLDGKVVKLFYSSLKSGAETSSLIPEIVIRALSMLPIPKRMRWGSSKEEFVRPVHWAVLLFGDKLIPATILGVKTARYTYGHRFHCPDKIELSSPAVYEERLLDPGFVIPCFAARKKKISDLVKVEGKNLGAIPVIDGALLDEVTALVEWPVALTGQFDKEFLSLPREALISSLKEHQKCFYVLDRKQNILPCFIAISNLVSQDPQAVIDGNEKVIAARLADAAFFYEQDKKQSLESRREKLKNIVFQQQLGSVYEKSERVVNLVRFIARTLNIDAALSERAAILGKCDLLCSMVSEFAELQGIMGYYYALNDGEPESVAIALNEQYLPRFSGDALPGSDAGTVLALAERIDTLVGLFGISQPPTGSGDPFALRRAALGILRIIIEKELDLDLAVCIREAIKGFKDLPQSEGLETNVLDFIFDRLRSRYAEEGVATDIFQAVAAVRPANPHEFDLRINAVNRFKQLPEAVALASANKRVSNILAKLERAPSDSVNKKLLTESAEISLAESLAEKITEVEPLFNNREYTEALESLASLQKNIDRFFDEVMVNTEDSATRNNRQALLQQLRQLFLRIADISYLQST